MTLQIQITTNSGPIVTICEELVDIDHEQWKKKLNGPDDVILKLEDLIDLIRLERAKNVVEKKSVDILPQGSDGEFILSEDDLDDSDSGDSFEVVQTATSPPKCTIAAKFPLAPFPSAGQFENEKENLLIPTRVKSPIEIAKNEIEKADSPSTSTSESFEELQTHEKQLPDKTRFNTRGLRAGYANRGTRGRPTKPKLNKGQKMEEYRQKSRQNRLQDGFEVSKK